jgi:hypothetical protein
LQTLQPLIDELVPHKPEFEELQVIGKNPLLDKGGNIEDEHQGITDLNDIYVDNTWVNPNIINKQQNDNPYFMGADEEDDNYDNSGNDLLAQQPDVNDEPLFGPAILFGGQTANWTGSDTDNLGIVALESRLNFETKAGKRVLATFEIHNIGTTAIYFDWKVKLRYLNYLKEQLLIFFK